MIETNIKHFFDLCVQEGKQEFLVRALKARFKSVPSSISERISQIHDQEVLDTLFDKAMTVRGLDEFKKALPE